jgi:type I restriction enzyme S subunit
MNYEPLLSIAPFSGARVKPYAGTRPFLSTGDLQDDSLSFEQVTYHDRPSRADISVQEGDVLFARMKGTKKVLEVTQDLAGAIVSTGFAVLRPTERYSSKYLAIYLRSNDFERQKTKYCSGSVQPAITNGGIEKLEIPVPPLHDQIRIAHLLGKLEGLIAQRKQHLQKLDNLLKSVFLEMFGDPVVNEKAWGLSSIEALCEAVVDCPHSTPLYSETKTGYYCVRSGDIVNGYLDLSATYQVAQGIFEDRVAKYRPQINDIVYSREGGRLGNAARIIGAEPICLGQRMMLFNVNQSCKPEFLWALLESVRFKAKLQGLIGGGAAPRVNIKDLKKVVVIKPDLNLQISFSKIVLKVDQLRNRYLLSLTDLEGLYGALSQKAFKGELDLSHVLIASIENEQEGESMPVVSATKTPAVVLPAPAADAQLNEPKQRKQAITEWLHAYLRQLGQGGAFATQAFVAASNDRLLAREDETNAWGPLDYDQLKVLVFEALAFGTLTQTFDEAGTRIALQRSVTTQTQS